MFIRIYQKNVYRFSQIGVVSYGHECPSHGVYARITEVKHWIQYVAGGAVDSNCDDQIPLQQGMWPVRLNFLLIQS